MVDVLHEKVGTSSMNSNPSMNSCNGYSMVPPLQTVHTRITVHTYRDNTIPCNGKVSWLVDGVQPAITLPLYGIVSSR